MGSQGGTFMFWIKALKNLLAVLQSSDSPFQIAFGVSLGAWLGLSPMGTPQAILLFLILMGTKSNLGAASLATVLFAGIGFLLDPLANQLGYWLLAGTPALTSFWTQAYNAPIVPFTRFYNTVVLGNGLLGLLLFVPLVFLARAGVLYYRAHLQEKVNRWKIMKVLNLTKVADLAGKVKK
jgi:uncharacterized protein (TIGR03546 family)